MALATGFDVIVKLVSLGACACTNDQIALTGGTCTKIPYLDSYTLNGTRAMIDATGFGDKITKVIPGIPSLEFSFSGGLDLTDTIQLAFWNALSCSVPATRTMKVWDGSKKVTIKGYVTGQQLGSTPTGKSTFSATLSATHLPKTC